MTVELVSIGGAVALSERSRRTTVHLPATGTPPATLVLPPRALETNSAAVVGVLETARSQGPTMSLLVMLSTGVPLSLSTMRQPTGLSPGRAPPAAVGRLPTTTQPPGRMPSAVVRPIPPGHDMPAGSCENWANKLVEPLGETWTMLVPVPCTLALLLKLLTRVSPATRAPMEVGTTATP